MAGKVELRREILKVQTLLLSVEYQPSLGLIEQSNTVQHFRSVLKLYHGPKNVICLSHKPELGRALITTEQETKIQT